jgi:ribosomal-protein-alanine N-acetyltransferase
MMTIETARLCLRRMSAEDTDDLLLIFSDPRVMASFDDQLFDGSMMERWVRRNLEHQAQYGYGLFSVFLRDDGPLIGDCGLEHMEVEGRPEVELGYDFRSDHWGRGFATEAALAVRDFAFDSLGIARLVSLIRPSNVASCRVAEKIGMIKEYEIERGGHAYSVYSVSAREA